MDFVPIRKVQTKDTLNNLLPNVPGPLGYTGEAPDKTFSPELIDDKFIPIRKLEKKAGFLEKVGEEAPVIAGSVAGGIGGFAVGGPVGAIVGAGLGGGAGEAYKQIGQHLAGDENAPQTSVEAAKKIGYAGAREAALEATGQGLVVGTGKVLAPFAKKVSPEAAEAINYLKDKIKPALLPAEATESRTIDILQNIGESSLLGGGKMAAFRINRDKVLDDMAGDIIDQFGKRAEPDVAGELLLGVINGKQDAHAAASNVLYNTVRDLVGDKIRTVPITKTVDTGILDSAGNPIKKTIPAGVKEVVDSKIMVNIEPLKNFTKPMQKIAKELNSIAGTNAGDNLVSAISGMKNNITVDAAIDLRTRLLSVVSEFNVTNKNAPAIGLSNRAIQLVDKAISDSLKKSSPKAYEAWRTANQFYKHGQKEFNNKFIRGLIKKGDPDLGGSPENIVKAIFKPGAMTNIERVKTVVGPKEWRQLQSYYIQDLLAKSTNKDGTIVGSNLINNMFGRSGMGRKTLNKIFTPEQLHGIELFANTLKLTQSKGSEGAGKVWIQLMQGGAAASLLTGKYTGQAAAVMLAPPAISRIMLNPVGAKWLTTGIKLPADSPMIGGISSRLLGLSTRIERDHKKYLDDQQ